MIELGRDFCNDFQQAASREWLETNGIGGYALSTVSGANTRRYHGLLIAAVEPPLGRLVLLSKFEETLLIDGESFELSANQFSGAIEPEGFKYLRNFRLDPFPIWTYDFKGIVLEKRVFMVDGENTTVCQWKLIDGPKTAELLLRPLLAFRDHHHLRHEESSFNGNYTVEDGIIAFRPYASMPALYLAHNASMVEKTGDWYRNFEYEIERERGFDFTEELFQPCRLSLDLKETAVVIASTEKKHANAAAHLDETELNRRAMLIVRAEAEEGFTRQLVLAADQFIVKRGTGKTVLAGYPWFSDWGRDTMIALNGLTLATNRPQVAKSIITEFSHHISEGMIPNRFPDEGETPDYNTVDATLWYFEAIRAYAETTGDLEFVRETLYEKLKNIIDWHVHGTRYRIHVDSDGLLYAGEPGKQLTWMDAKIGDWVVTPRIGKPVEIQALWYNALCIMNDLATTFGDAESQPIYFEMATIAKASFNGQFWNEAENCLFDVINGAEKDASVRPNQIFAVSLPHSILDPKYARSVVDKVEVELLTPLGLRSLSTQDPSYVPIYSGTPLQRDGSYHQGTVWGWLIGGFVDAYRKVHAGEKGTEKIVSSILSEFHTHLISAGLGSVSEIFDGDDPHLPRGCPAQAWSVAELLRVSR